jgi:hypothetical protein
VSGLIAVLDPSRVSSSWAGNPAFWAKRSLGQREQDIRKRRITGKNPRHVKVFIKHSAGYFAIHTELIPAFNEIVSACVT